MKTKNEKTKGKPAFVPISSALHKAALGEGKKRGQNAGEVYTEAITRWLEWVEKGARVQTVFGEASSDHAEILRALLWDLQLGQTSKEARAVLNVILEDYRAKHRGTSER